MGLDFYFIKRFTSEINNFIYQSINYLISVIFRMIMVFYLSITPQFSYKLLEISIYITLIIFFIKIILLLVKPFNNNQGYGYLIDTYYRVYILNIYLMYIYILNYGISINYVKGLFYFYFIKVKILVKNIFLTVITIIRVRSFWYPLFKKYSYFGYSRFTKNNNSFYK